MQARNVVPVIPMRESRKLRVAVDRTLYRLRDLVARCSNRLKNARRVATRHIKPQTASRPSSTSRRSDSGSAICQPDLEAYIFAALQLERFPRFRRGRDLEAEFLDDTTDLRHLLSVARRHFAGADIE